MIDWCLMPTLTVFQLYLGVGQVQNVIRSIYTNSMHQLPTIKKMYLISHNNDIIRLDDCHNLQQTTIEWEYVSFLLINNCVICLVEVRQKFELHFYVCFSNEIDIPVNWHPVGQVSL